MRKEIFNISSRVSFFYNKYLEIILVDNGSKDLTYKTLNYFKKIFKKLNIKILKIKKNNIGFGNGVFAGLKKSAENSFCYTHADRETKIIDLQKVCLIDINYNSDFLIKGRRVNRMSILDILR